MDIKRFCYFTTVLLLSLVFFPPTVSANDGWRLERDERGVAIYTRYVEDSDFIEVKGVTVINASITVLAEVMRDVPALPEWMMSCTKGMIIKDFDQNNKILYNVLDFPWPAQDRDVIIKSTTTIDPDTGAIIIDSRATKEPLVPVSKDYTRLKELNQQFMLEFIEREETKVTFIIHLESEGFLPASVVDEYMRDIPYESLISMKKMVKRDEYKNSDFLAEENIETTKAVLGIHLKKYIKKDELIEMLMKDNELIEMALNAGTSEKGVKGVATSFLRKYLGNKDFNQKMIKDRELLAMIEKDKELIEVIANDNEMIDLVFKGDQTNERTMSRFKAQYRKNRSR